MSKKLNNEVMLGGFIVAAGGLLAYMAVAVGGFNMTPGIHVKAKFSNAAGLVKDASISVAGVEVGHIESLTVEHDKAVVTMFLNKDAGIRKDVAAAIRAKSLLGEKYLELSPRSIDAPLLANGDVITETRASVEVDELMASLGPIIKQIDPKDVADIVKVVAKTARDEQGSIAALVHNAAQISSEVNDMVAANKTNVNQIAANVAALTKEGNALLTAKRPEIERTVTNVDKLAGVLSAEAPALTKKADRIASNVDAITSDLKQHTPALGRTLVNADKTLARGPELIDDLGKLQKAVDVTLGKANPLLDKANAFDAGKAREMAEELLLNTGVKVYMHPFGPAESDWKKIPQKQ